MTRVLLVEDDEHLSTALALTMRARGYAVTTAATGASAVHEAGHRRHEVVILDLGLPDMDGTEVIARIRERGWQVPVIVLSARREEASKVRALDAGADDYMTKPFGADELLARIRAAERRLAPPAELRIVHTPHFTVDLGTKTAHDTSGTAIRLTPTEWGVLECLIRANGLLVPSSELLSHVWGPEFASQGNYLRVYVNQLRRKLEPEPSFPRYLINAPGIGYRFTASGDPSGA